VKATFLAWNGKNDESNALLQKRKQFPRESLELAMNQVNLSWVVTDEASRNKALDLLKDADTVAKGYMDNEKKMKELVSDFKADWTDAVKAIFMLECRLCYAESLLQRAFVQLSLGSYVKGAFNFRKAFKLFQEIEKDSLKCKVSGEIQDLIKFNTGIFLFMTSFAPGVFMKVLEFFGFVSDREKGIRYLTEVFEAGGLRSPLAGLFLMLNFLVIPRGLTSIADNMKQAHVVIEKANKMLPESVFFQLMNGQLLLKEGDLPGAIVCHEKAIKGCENLGVIPTSFHFNLAVCYYVARDWKKAASILEQITSEQTKKFDMKGLAALQLASCYHMSGETEKGAKFLDKVPSFITKSSRFDKLAERKAAAYKKRGLGLASYELMFFRRDLHHLKKKDAEEILKELESSYAKMKDNSEDRSTFLLMKSVLIRILGNSKEAKEVLQSIINMEKEIKEEIWVIPNALQEFAEILYFEGKIDEAETLLKKAIKYNGYDWHETVQNRIKLSLDTIKKDRKEGSNKGEKYQIPDDELLTEKQLEAVTHDEKSDDELD